LYDLKRMEFGWNLVSNVHSLSLSKALHWPDPWIQALYFLLGTTVLCYFRFVKACQLTLIWAKRIQFTASNSISLNFALIWNTTQAPVSQAVFYTDFSGQNFLQDSVSTSNLSMCVNLPLVTPFLKKLTGGKKKKKYIYQA
jgi:hypothetical protein